MTSSKDDFSDPYNFPKTMPLPLDRLPVATSTITLQQPSDPHVATASPHRVAVNPAALADAQPIAESTVLPRRRASDGGTGLFARFSLHRRRSSDVMPELDSGGRPLPRTSSSATGWALERQRPIRLLIRGFNIDERGLLEGTVRLSQRRPPQLDLVLEYEADTADFVMVDGGDPEAVAWAEARPWLTRQNMIWIDSRLPRPGQTESHRPVPWLLLPTLLAHAIEQLQGPQVSSVAAAPRAAAPAANPDVAAVCDEHPENAGVIQAPSDEHEHG